MEPLQLENTEVIDHASILDGDAAWKVQPEPTPPAADESIRIGDAGDTRVVWFNRVWPWLALAISVVSMSSGGVWFAALRDTPPIVKASWRLLLTSILQAPGMIIQYKQADGDLRLRWRSKMPLMLATGCVLALHFGAWSWSIDLTSLTHSLLFVSTTPVILVMYFAIKHLVTRTTGTEHRIVRLICCLTGEAPTMPTLLELTGIAVAFAAATSLAVSASNASNSKENNSNTTTDVEPSVVGDMVALLGAAMMGIYLLVGSRLREWMPLFMYAFPVTLSSAICSSVFALLIERDATLVGPASTSLFGWLYGSREFGLTLGAAFCAGMLGHTMCNLSLMHISSLVVSVALLMEPVAGSVIGALAGVQAVPGTSTVVPGLLLICGAVVVTLGERGSASNTAFEQKLHSCIRTFSSQQARV